MDRIPTDSVSVLLVCPEGLMQKSLITAVNAVPLAHIVGRAVNADSALRQAQKLSPDVLLADANPLKDELLSLLKKSKENCPKMFCIVVTVSAFTMQNLPFLHAGADFILDDKNLDQELTQIFRNIQAFQKNRPSIEPDDKK